MLFSEGADLCSWWLQSQSVAPPPSHWLGWGCSKPGRAQAILEPWPGLSYHPSGATDVAAGSGNLSSGKVAVPGRRTCLASCQPSPAQLSQKPEEALSWFLISSMTN